MSVRKRIWKTREGEQREAWICSYYDGDGRHIETFTRKKDADARHAEIKTNIRSGVHKAPRLTPTVAEAGEIWLKAAEARGLERSTIKQYTEHLRLHLIPVIGNRRLADISAPDICDLMDHLGGDRSKVMVKMIMGSLNAIFAAAMRRGMAATNPVRDMPRANSGSEKRHRRKLVVGEDIPSLDEIARIIKSAEGRWRVILVTAAFTGLRASELRGLRWSDVDLDKHELHVRQRADRFNKIGDPKSAAGIRTVPFGKHLANTLREWKLQCPKGELDLVFPTGRGNILALSHLIDRGLKPACVAALGYPKYTGMHVLRHFYASWLIDRKFSPKQVQTWLGHSSITMTYDTYGHLFPGQVDADEMERAESIVMLRKTHGLG